MRKFLAVVVVVIGGLYAIGVYAPPSHSERAPDKRAGMMACLDARGDAELFGAPFRCMKAAGLYSASDCMELPPQYGIRCLQEVEIGLNVQKSVDAMRKKL